MANLSKESEIDRSNRFQYCASGRTRLEVQALLADLIKEQRRIDRALHEQRVMLCKQAWDAKYEKEYIFDPAAAYVSLVSGDKLDQRLCLDMFNITNAICALNEELAERHDG